MPPVIPSECERISSAQNPKIKNLLLLQEKSRARREQGLFVVEGRRELQHCLEAGFEIDTLFVLEEMADQINSPAPRVIALPRSLFEKVTYRGATEGVVAEVRIKERRLEDLTLRENPLIVVIEGVEKPGNIGAILRSADAAGADAMLVCDPLTDLWNPNLIRASLGGIFTVPTVACTSEEAISFLQARGIAILTAQLQDSELYYDTPMTGGTALVMGTESTGLTDRWRKAATAHIRIPMQGQLDSLNVSVSTAILLYEAVRQRQPR
ncbi:MAG: RNA methyltransferase [Bacteroidales bacterium]|nr:RNA methyltransferase [Bacteroidales bacterium]